MGVEIEHIEFDCEIRQVKTCVDHTANVTINIPEYQVQQAAEIMRHIGDMATIALVFAPVEKQVGSKDDIQARSERKSQRASS